MGDAACYRDKCSHCLPTKRSSGMGTVMNLCSMNVGKMYIHLKSPEQTTDSEILREKEVGTGKWQGASACRDYSKAQKV